MLLQDPAAQHDMRTPHASVAATNEHNACFKPCSCQNGGMHGVSPLQPQASTTTVSCKVSAER